MLVIPEYCRKIYWWLFPPICILCSHPSTQLQDLCQRCRNDLPILPQSCPRCANSFAMDTPPELICGHCITRPPPFDATYALYPYKAPITKLIMELKFNQRLINARILGENIAHVAKNVWYINKRLPDMIIPVPLHPQRLKERGFNQAVELAKPIANLLALPMNITSCLRIKHTAAQAMLPAEDRTKNMKNAFLIKDDFTNQHLAVLDDVITTGQTITELCLALKKAGANRIDVWCCAKALLNKY